MGEYAPPADTATCGSSSDEVVVATAATVPVAFDFAPAADACLELDLQGETNLALQVAPDLDGAIGRAVT